MKMCPSVRPSRRENLCFFPLSEGGELFAKRKKRADKWVVDESSLGSKDPKLFAEGFVQQQSAQQQQIILEKQQEMQMKFAEQEMAKQQALQEQKEFQVCSIGVSSHIYIYIYIYIHVE